MPEDLPDRMSKRIPEDIPERMSEDRSERTAKDISDMSDRMAEDMSCQIEPGEGDEEESCPLLLVLARHLCQKECQYGTNI